MNEAQSDLRGVLIQVTGGRLLLPNACIAEILSVADAEPIAGAPEWLLGHVHWHGWNVPLVAYSTLAGLGAHDAAQRGQRVLVLKTLSADLTMPYFALLTQGYPRLVKVNAADIEDDGAPAGDGHCVAAMARLQGEEVLVPDLDALELRLVEVLAAAA
ncbi:chemotaxis protein CheW [Luteimonas sp. e5]